MFLGLPVAFAAFGYQGIVPTLVNYMDFDVPKLRKAILIGSFIPFLTYVIWQWLILGIVPTEGPHGLKETLELGQNAVYPLRYFINHSNLTLLGQFFAFFALATSFFGVTLGMVDFLADGLRVEKSVKGRLLLCALIYIPPLIFSLTNPHVFLVALDYAGGFGSALLLGLLPILMVWSGRYKMGLKSSYALFGGRPLLVVLIGFVLFELIVELKHVFLKNF
jgi:tyrosine-specific transport protein